MKKISRILILCLAVMLLLTACTKKADPSPSVSKMPKPERSTAPEASPSESEAPSPSETTPVASEPFTGEASGVYFDTKSSTADVMEYMVSSEWTNEENAYGSYYYMKDTSFFNINYQAGSVGSVTDLVFTQTFSSFLSTISGEQIGESEDLTIDGHPGKLLTFEFEQMSVEFKGQLLLVITNDGIGIFQFACLPDDFEATQAMFTDYIGTISFI